MGFAEGDMLMQIKNKTNTAEDYQRARKLRNEASPAEKELWRAIRALSKTRRLKFRRQHAIHPFIADFACLKARLLIELDGESHDARQAYDKDRDAYLKGLDFEILRFSNQDILENAEGIANVLFDYAETLISKAIK